MTGDQLMSETEGKTTERWEAALGEFHFFFDPGPVSARPLDLSPAPSSSFFPPEM